MTAQLSPAPIFKAFDNVGLPLAFGKLYTYQAGTTTPQATYTDSTGNTPNPNPITLNARGETPLWLNPTLNYKFALTDALGNQIPGWPVDNINGSLYPGNSIIPNTSNAFTLGSAQFSWANGYFGPNCVPVFDPGSGAIGYWPRTAAEIAAGVTPVNYAWPVGWAPRYGVVGSGAVDDSTAFQTMVNANKGGFCYVPAWMTPMIAGVTLIGPTYSGTVLRVDGELLLKASPSAGTHNYQTAWVGIAFENCDHCGFEGAWNGNRSNQPQDQGIFCVALSGATRWRSTSIRFRELRGDGVYLNQVAWDTNASAACQNVSISQITGYNSANDGRNLISVIACQGLAIGSLDSYQIGGVVNSSTMPGGFDCEPNFSFQSCTDISIGSANIVTAGTNGFQFAGIAITNDSTRDWNIQRVSVGSVTLHGTSANAGAVIIQRVRQITARGVVQTDGSTSYPLFADYADKVALDFVLNGGQYGAFIGNAGGVNDFEMQLNVSGYSTYGIRALILTRGRLRGRVFGSTNSSAHAIELGASPTTITQTDVTWSVDCPYDGTQLYGIHTQNALVLTDTCVRDCDMRGYPSLTNQIFTDGPAIASYNIFGRNLGTGLTAAPTAGVWLAGDEVALDQTAGSTAPRAKCTSGGLPGTWKTYGVMSA